MRDISQFTGLKKDIVKPAIAQLVMENQLTVINNNGKERYMVSN